MGEDGTHGAFTTGRAQGDTDPFAAAVRATRMPMIICDAHAPDIPIIFANDAFLAATGYPEDQVVGHNCRFLQGPDTDPATVALIRQAVRDRHDIHAEILNYRADGSTFWNALFVGPVRDAEGGVRYFFGSQMDVTARKEAELRIRAEKAAIEAAVSERTRSLSQALEARNTLLHEVDHRVKNNLQTIAALVAMEGRGLVDPEGRAAFGRLTRRVEAVATVHRRLYEEEMVDRFDVVGFARTLVDQLAASLAAPIVPDLAEDPILVPAAQASPIALMLNELLVEAAASGGSEVTMTLRRAGADRFRVVVAPLGDAASQAARNGGSGLVPRLVRQLRGELTRAGGGATVELPCASAPA